MELKLGYKASAEQFAPRELLEYSVQAEAHGFDSIVVSDHYQPWRHNGGHAPFSFAWLAALGERTKNVTIGTSVVAPTFRYHPSIVAQAMATLGCMYPGRVMLGVGTGESMNEVPPTGIEWPEPPERFHRMKEAILLMRQLWAEDFVTFEGDFYQTRSATVYDRPDEPVPVYIAGSGPAAARLAGRMGDGFICTSGKDPNLYNNVLLPAVAEGVEKAGRDDSDLEKMIEMKVSFDVDRQSAMEDTRIWAALALPPEAKTGVEDPRELERLADELPLEKAASRWLVSDDPEEHIEQIRPYIDMGFTHLVFHFPGDDQERSIELYGEKIMPLIRSTFG